jgi:subtilisin family serine protease
MQTKLFSPFYGSLVIVLALTGASAAPLAAGPSEVTDGSRPAQAAGSPLLRKKAATKLTLGLDTLSAEYQAHQQAVRRGAAEPGGFRAQAPMAQAVDEFEETVAIDAVAAGDPQDLKAGLEALGAEVKAIAGRIVSARVPLSQLPALEDLDSLQFARPALASTQSGSVTSQGDVAQYSNLARTTFGVNGAGQLVGVLSDSFNCSGNGSYAADQASGDLPAGVSILDDTACPGSDEGRAMAQIVHDVAPGAGLAFHTAFLGQASFAQGIRDLAAAGASVIVDDIIFFAEPMFQDGVIAQAVDEVTAQGVAYFSSAANFGRQSYEAPFRPSGFFDDFGFEFHDFDPGAGIDTWQRFTFDGDPAARLILQWDEPFFSVSGPPGSASDVDICVSTTPSFFGLLGCAQELNVGSDPIEQLVLGGALPGSYYFAILQAGPYPDLIKYVWTGGISNLEHATNSPTSYGHFNAAGANTVGAANYSDTPAFGTTPPRLAPYSSAGGIPILFDTTGNPTYVLRQKPDFTAPDRGNNTFFGSDVEPDGFPNFSGTSAAAPHAAGVAALMLQADPSLTPAAIKMALKDSAIDIVARDNGALVGVGFDNDSGAGLIDAEVAVDSVFDLEPIWLPNDPAQVNHRWTFISAPSGFTNPIVITGPPTYAGADPGVARVRNVSSAGFGLRFAEWDYLDGAHAVEEIAYSVVEQGRHTLSDGSVAEAGRFSLGGTGAWQSVAFSAPFASVPRLFLTAQTASGGQTVSVRARNVTKDGFQAALFEQESLMDGHVPETIGYLAIRSPKGSGRITIDGAARPYLLQTLNLNERWAPVMSQRLKLEEERSRDPEIGHVDETVHMLALGNQMFAQQVTSNGFDTTALRQLPMNAVLAPMEWGIMRGIADRWQTLPFAKTYNNPIVVAKPVANNGGDPGVIRMRNRRGTDIELRYDEWDYLDGFHPAQEEVFYLISEAGNHNVGGLTIEARQLSTNKLGRAGQWEGVTFTPLRFNTPPAVFSSVMTYLGADAVTTRIRSLDALGFDIAMDEQESKSDGHTNETLGWIALRTGPGTTADGRKLRVFFKSVDGTLTPTAYGLGAPTAHRFPTIIGDVDSTVGADPVFLRYAAPNRTDIKLKLAEEQSADNETGHVPENVGVFVGE